MGTDNIRARIQKVDTENKKGRIAHHPQGWSQGRALVLGQANKIIWQYIELLVVPIQEVHSMADRIDANSLSKQVDNQLKYEQSKYEQSKSLMDMGSKFETV